MQLPEIFDQTINIETYIYQSFKQHINFQPTHVFMSLNTFVQCDEINDRADFKPINDNDWSGKMSFGEAEIVIDETLIDYIVFANQDYAIKLNKQEEV